MKSYAGTPMGEDYTFGSTVETMEKVSAPIMTVNGAAVTGTVSVDRGDALELAFDRTVVKTSKMNWAYMDKILRTWQEKGLFTPEDIEKGDVKPGRRVRPQKEREPAPDRGDDLDRLERILSGKE